MRDDLGWDTTCSNKYQAHRSRMHRIAHQQVDTPAEMYLTPLVNRTRGIDSRFGQVLISFPAYQHTLHCTFPARMGKWVPYGQNQGMMPKLDPCGSHIGILANVGPT